MTSFSKKKIDVILQLQNNKTFDNGNTTLKISGLRVEADIKNAGGMLGDIKSRIKIYGLSLSDMNKLSVITNNFDQKGQSVVTLMAGDDTTMTQVFNGFIIQGWADFSGMPESCMTIDASPSYGQQIAPADGTATQTETPVADMMKDLATKMGYGFENHGVDGTLSAMTLKGSYIDQARTVANASGIFWTIDNNVLMIAPRGMPIRKGEIPVFSETSGLLGYPAVSSNGISITCLFNPMIRQNDLIEVKSPIEPANGQWLVSALHYRLESEKAGGAWFCQIEAIKMNNSAGTPNNV